MPDWKPPLAARLASLRLSPARERDIIDELSQHLDEIYRERRAGGASHDEAVRLALEELDEGDRLEREMRPLRQASTRQLSPPGASSGNWIADAAQDLVYAVRTLLHARGWATVIVLLLALGIGANAALFSATNALLLAPVPARDPDALVRLLWTGRNGALTEHDEYGFLRRGPAGRVFASMSFNVFQQLAAQARGTADLFAFAPALQMTLVIDGQAELATGLGATGNYYAVLGVRPRAGRLFGPDDDRPAATPVAVISSRYWQSRFGGDPAVLGKVIRANDIPVTIVGVTPPEFTGVQSPLASAPDISFPLAIDTQLRASTGRGQASLLTQPTAWWLVVMGRLQPGATSAQLQARLNGVFQRTARTDMDAYMKSLPQEERGESINRTRADDIPQLLATSGRRGAYDVETNAVTAASLLSAVVAVILLIICANVANLMLSRAVARQKEIAVRLSLGASRGRLVRQLLTESLVLACLGAALGLVVATWGVQLLPAPASSVSVWRGSTFAFVTLTAIFTTLFFGVVPALRATRVDLNAGLRDAGRSVGGSRSRLSRGLLVVQVALSVVLLVGAGLFLQTLSHLRHVDVGFDPQNLLLVRVTPRLSGYDMPRTTDLYRTLLERFSTLPGVRGAALSQPALLAGSISSTNIYVSGRAAPAGADDASKHDINRLVVSPGFLKVLGIPVVRGRDLTDRDDRTSPPVALINETAARTYFPGEDPIGKRFGGRPERSAETEIVGVVRDARYSSLRDPAPPTMYVTYLQSPRAAAVFALRSAAAPASIAGSIREAVRGVDPNLPLGAMTTQTDEIEKRLFQERLFANAYTLFGAAALLLASVGLFGLMSYTVSRRTPEMGIRMALGAQRRAVVHMVMRESLTLVLAGIGIGLVLAVGAGRYVASLLFGLAPYDLRTVAAAIAVMVFVSAGAAYLPARRASRVDPMIALRYE